MMSACLEVLDKVQKRTVGFTLSLKQPRAGAEFYLEQGVDITEEDMRSVQDADAILLGAMGLQNVRFPNGTEIAPHLKIRTELGLFAWMSGLPRLTLKHLNACLIHARNKLILWYSGNPRKDCLHNAKKASSWMTVRHVRHWSSLGRPVKDCLISVSN